LPRLTAVTPITGGVSWTLSGSGPVDLITVSVSELGQKGERVGAWTASLPGDATALVWPRIPGAPIGTPSVRLSDIDIVDGYHQLRARAASTDWIPAIATGYDLHSTFR